MKQGKKQGYCIIAEKACLSLLENRLVYTEVADWVRDFVYSGYDNLATEMFKYERPGLCQQICRSLDVTNTRVAARPITTVKTHASPGRLDYEAYVRPADLRFGGLGRYVRVKKSFGTN